MGRDNLSGKVLSNCEVRKDNLIGKVSKKEAIVKAIMLLLK